MYKSILGVVFIFLATSTHAVTLNSGETVPLFGTTAILSPETAGLILDEQVSNFTVDIDGKMVTGAVSQRLRNFGFGFVIDYRITSFDDQGLGLQIEGLNTNAFFGVGEIGPLDVDYRLDESGDVFPVTASLQFDGNPVEFDFGSNPLLAGETSRWMFVGDPNNDLVTFGGFGAQLLVVDMNGAQISIPFASYVTFIPIPAAVWLFGSGLIGLFVFARRKGHV